MNGENAVVCRGTRISGRARLNYPRTLSCIRRPGDFSTCIHIFRDDGISKFELDGVLMEHL